MYLFIYRIKCIDLIFKSHNIKSQLCLSHQVSMAMNVRQQIEVISSSWDIYKLTTLGHLTLSYTQMAHMALVSLDLSIVYHPQPQVLN